MKIFPIAFSFLILISQLKASANDKTTEETILKTMKDATEFMVEKVSTEGGYLWYYLPDFSRRWGEMEAYPSMIWLQNPGTISMGHMFLDAYHLTDDEYYYNAAIMVAQAIIKGQHEEGGWNYLIDFAGEASIQKWYNTIGKNGWRLEEFQHYYGNCTFDDDVTPEAARYLLRIYLEKLDPAIKPALNKAINFILKSQYPVGAWPQRYPLRYDFINKGHPDYTSYYTFNDDVIWENIQFLVQCYHSLGDDKYLEPIKKGMQFYILSQDTCGAWGQQLTMDLKVAGARTYEPAAFLPSTTCENAFLLLKFYQYTGDTMFLAGVPKAIKWLEKTKLPDDKIEGLRTHPTFVDAETQKAVYLHRKGSNVKYGCYYMDENDQHLLRHYYGKARIPLANLKEEYVRIKSLSKEEATKDSPLRMAPISDTEDKKLVYYNIKENNYPFEVTEERVQQVINALDDQNRWLTTRAYISNPYIGEGKFSDSTDLYAETMVGDSTDTSPYENTTSQLYISTREYLRNMMILKRYLEQSSLKQEENK